MAPVSVHSRRQARDRSSVKSSDHTSELATPALVSEARRLSAPTRPGHSPDQLAAMRIGPRWRVRPMSTCWLYCHTASATTRGASGSMVANTSRPCAWEPMNPWPRPASTAWARSTVHPSEVSAALSARSSSAWAGQHSTLADSRRSPLATSSAVRPAAGGSVAAGLAVWSVSGTSVAVMGSPRVSRGWAGRSRAGRRRPPPGRPPPGSGGRPLGRQRRSPGPAR